MSGFARAIRPHVDQELAAAARARAEGDPVREFLHLERAHVLGQSAIAQHVRVHWRMLVWGLRQRSAREVAGQLLRLVGAATKTALGAVPTGNTGGSNVSAIRPMPLPADLAAILEQARGAR